MGGLALVDGEGVEEAALAVADVLGPDEFEVDTEDGVVKIRDFGLAKAAPLPGANADATLAAEQARPEPPALTERCAIRGTLGYIAPEQVLGRPAEPRADLFAFGVVLCEMLAGRRPFAGRSAPEEIGVTIPAEVLKRADRVTK